MSDPISTDNPYLPPNEDDDLREPHLDFTLGKVYWGLMIATLVIDAFLVFVPLNWSANNKSPFLAQVLQNPTSRTGLFGGLVTGLAMVYGMAYMFRIVCRKYSSRHAEVQNHQFAFYVRGMFIGTVLTVSTLTAFVCCCVPVSMPFVSYSAGGGMSGDTRPATVFAVLFALILCGFIVRMILPREDLR